MIRTDAGSGTAVALVAATVLQVLVVAVLLLPLGAVYVFGLYISIGISLWRLVQRDYGAADGDPSTANLTPALDILYVLPLVQGALLCYRAIFSVSKREHVVVNRVLARYELDEEGERRSVWDYFRETMAGCEKDPSFARGRNLITHAVDLMASTSPETYLSGARLLDALLGRVSYAPSSVDAHGEQRPRLRNIVAKVLLESASGTKLIWKLLRTLDSRGQYDETARAQAASILVHLGGYIHLEQFPGAMQCIKPLLEPITPLVRRPEKIQAMRILQNLTSNSGNVVAIIGNPDLMVNITALLDMHFLPPTSSGHDALSVQLSLESLVLVRRLFEGLQEFPPSIRQTVRDYNTFQTLRATKSILMCNMCDDSLQAEAIKTLPYLLLSQGIARRGVIIDPSEKRKRFMTILIDVFLRGRKNYSRELAGEKLAILSSELDAPIVFDRVDNFVASLRGILADDVRDSEYWCRIQAAHILKNLCSHSSSYCPSSLQTLKEALVHAVPQVLREMLDIHMGLQAVTETYGGRFSAATGTDSAEGRDPQDVGGPRDQKQQQALLSECAAACDKLVATDQDLARRLDFIAAQICSEAGQPVRSWVDLIKQAREIVKDPSFAGGRSLIRYAMDMMASTSSKSYLVGAEILDTLLGRCSYEQFSDIEREQRPWLCCYVGNIVTASNERLIANLLLMLGPTVVPHDEEARARAARILEHIGCYIRLSELQLKDITVAFESLSSTLSSTPRWEEVLQGMRILRRLSAGRDNAIRIGRIPDLLAKIPMLLDYHRFLGPDPDHNAWSASAWESLVLIRRVFDSDMLSKSDELRTIRATKDILMCERCDDPLQKEAMRMYLHHIILNRYECKKESIAILIDVFARGKRGHAKAMVEGDVVAGLKGILVDAEYQYRTQAARILKNLCTNHPCAKELKEAMTDAVPKVLREMLNIQMELRQAATLPCGEGFSAPDIDLEQGRLSQGVPRPDPQQQRDTIELQDALLSECATACEKLVAEDQGLAPRLDEIAAEICSEAGKRVRSWGALITEAQEVLKQQKEVLLR
ncbi:hypothetical protein C2845_PM13G12370 [Panicum miliaceum]|uniref:Uncharacterized protein n=1 Tax=Panicum miliaceum TaxID=4540 RepID=A0A3L6RFE4_PANMI|nr:hypothetical protein C2845_PM13G12370 [Panicum miliaceum]